MIVDGLRRAVQAGLLESAAPALRVVEETPAGWTAGRTTLVHGDLYIRHLLIDDRGRPCGVIDWGDVHLGDPAVDLSIAWALGPPSSHERFLSAYGAVDEDRWRMARFRALFYAVTLLLSGHDAADGDLVREGRLALEHVTA
jgi:aminoglycoside phosphotransferase (APT) family kinase protein